MHALPNPATPPITRGVRAGPHALTRAAPGSLVIQEKNVPENPYHFERNFAFSRFYENPTTLFG